MKLRLNSLASDIFIVIYVLATLFYRIKFENQVNTSPLKSLIIGACLMLILVALIKLKILNPNWFGFFNFKKPKS